MREWALYAILFAAAPARAGEDDVVEEIDLGEEGVDTAAPADTPEPPPRAPSRARFLLRGFTRTAGAAGLRDPDDDHDPEPARLHYDRYTVEEALLVEGGAAWDDAFEARAGALLQALGSLAESRPSLVPGDDTGDGRRDVDARLGEAWLAWHRPHLLLRGGWQRVVWGTSDAFRPNDVLDARDLRDGVQTESEILEIPTPKARVDWEPAVGAMVQLVAGPFRPDAYDLTGTNWALVQRPIPKVMRALVRMSDDPILLEKAPAPSAIDPRAWTAGWAMKLRPESADVDVYYHYGYDRTPLLSTAPELSAALATMSASSLDPDALAAVVDEIRADGREPSTSRYVRRHHVGVAVTTTHGSVVFRQDYAFDTARVFLQRDLDGVARPVLQGVLGLELQTGQMGRLFLVELAHLQILDAPADDTLLTMRAANTSVAGTARWTFGDFLVDARLVQGLHPRSTLLRPEVGWKRDRLDLRLGLLLLGGEARSTGDYYTESSSAYATVRYAF